MESRQEKEERIIQNLFFNHKFDHPIQFHGFDFDFDRLFWK